MTVALERVAVADVGAGGNDKPEHLNTALPSPFPSLHWGHTNCKMQRAPLGERRWARLIR